MSITSMKIVLHIGRITLSRTGELIDKLEKLQATIPEIIEITSQYVEFDIKKQEE